MGSKVAKETTGYSVELSDGQAMIQDSLSAWWQDNRGNYPKLAAKYNVKNGAKYRMASGLQKMIRRGYTTEAAHMAAAFYDFDKQYFVYRMATIACEDVGIGNVSVVGRFAAVTESGRNFPDERRVYSALAYDMAAGVKDRNACELVVMHNDSNPGEFEHFNKYGDVAKHFDLIAGVAKIAKRQGVGEYLWERLHVPCMLLATIDLLFRRQRTSFPMGMGVAYYMAGDHLENTTVEPDTYPWPCQKIKTMYPAAALDKHTREGQQAIAVLSRELGIDKVKAGWVLFTSEGSLCDKRLTYPGSLELVAAAKRVLDNMNGSESAYILGKFAAAKDRLHELREWALAKALKE